MLKEYKSFWKNMFNFKGRARRREYWVSYFWNMAVMLILYGLVFGSVFSCVKFTTDGVKPNTISIILVAIIGIITFAYLIAMLIGGIAISVRRCHDIGKKGTTVLFCILGSMVCGIGGIVWFVLSLFDSQEDNEWGVNPKNPEVDEYTNANGIIASIIASIIAFVIYGAIILFSGFSCVYKAEKAYHSLNNQTIFEEEYTNEDESSDFTDAKLAETNEEEIEENVEEDAEAEETMIEEDKEVVKEETDRQENSESGSEDWLAFELKIDGKLIKLPCTYSDIESLGFHLEADSPALKDEIEKDQYTTSYLVKDDKNRSFNIRFMNASGEKKKIVDAKIYSVEFDTFYDTPSVELCNGIKMGITKKEVIEIAGKADFDYESDDWGYSALAYYKNGNKYEGYMEIDFEDDVAVEINYENPAYQ